MRQLISTFIFSSILLISLAAFTEGSTTTTTMPGSVSSQEATITALKEKCKAEGKQGKDLVLCIKQIQTK